MFNNSAQPRENGRQTPRNIKATYGWLWQEKAALRLIAEHYTSNARQLVARSIYLALTEIASDQHTPTQARAACSYIGQRAAVTEGTARRYLHELAGLGLLTIEANGNRAFNTYHLLAVDVPHSDDLAASTMPLADSNKGISRASLALAETRTGVSLDAAKGITGEPQMKKKDSETNKQQQGVVLADSDSAVGNEPPQPSAEQQQAAQQLTRLGVRRSVADQVAQQFAAALILGWVAASARQGVRDRAAWVLAMIRTGDAPPAAAARISQQAGAVAWAARHGLTGGGLDTSKYLPGGKYGHLFNRDVDQSPTQGAS